MGTPDGTTVEDPATLEERRTCASHCATTLSLAPMRTLVDDLDDSANRAYEAWPDRLLLIDLQGRVAFRSPPGPYGFDPAELEKAILAELGHERVEG
jgi:type I thyroxine 5'-deiodinase